MNKGTIAYTVGGVLAVLAALVAIENFYEHPTFGRGLKAFSKTLLAAAALGY